VSFRGSDMRTGGVASSGGSVTRKEAGCVILGLVYMNWGCCIVWGLGYAKGGWLRRLGAGIHEMRLPASFGDLVMRTGGVCVIWGLAYAKQGCWCRLGARLYDPGVFVSSGVLFMRSKAAGVVWGLGCANRGCLHRLGARLCETRLLASFEGLVIRNGPIGIVWGHDYANWGPVYGRESCSRQLGLGCTKRACSTTHLMGLPILGSPLCSCSSPHPVCIVRMTAHIP